MCGRNTGALKQTNVAELKTGLLWRWNDLPQEFINKANFETSIVCCCSWRTLWTLSLNTETAADIHCRKVWSVDKKWCKVWFIITEYSGRDCI